MRVAVVTHYYPQPGEPWAGQSAYQTLRVLAKQCEVHVFCHEAERPRLLGGRQGGRGDRSFRTPDVTVSYLQYTTIPVVSRPFNGWTIARRLLEPVRAFGPDVILDYVVYPSGMAAVRIGKKLGVPVVLTAIGSDLNRVDPLSKRGTRAALRGADFVTTVSHDLAKTAVRMGADPERTRAILNGCDTNAFYPRDRGEARRALGIADEQEMVLYVGRFDRRKGLIELVDAAAMLRAKRPGMRTYLLGGGGDEAMVREAMAKHGVADAITLLPACTTEQVGVWMGAADVVTLPSYNEGCPNVVIEAMSSGRPVVATRVGGIPELMDESCGRMVAVQDVAGLAAGLDEVLGAVWDAEGIAAKRSRSWAEVAAELNEVLSGVRPRR